MTAIHQLVAGLNRGDAISNEAWLMQRLFRSWGYEAEVFSEPRRMAPEMRKRAGDAYTLPARCRPGDVVLLHLSIGSPLNDLFARLPCRKAMLYHNITPPSFLAAAQPRTAGLLEQGRTQLNRLVGVPEVTLADSAFNAAEMEAQGYQDVRVLPLLLDWGHLHAVDRRTWRRYADGAVNVLFVGRCVPNKAIDDLLRAFYYFQRYVEPDARLLHVGSLVGAERYHAMLLGMIRNLELRDVEFTGTVSQERLNAYYRAAHLFLCMSEHEGFCIPLLESMAHDVPVMAYAAGAVPETLAGAGVLFHAKQYDLVAEMMGRLVRPGVLRDAVIRKQRERLAAYRSRDLAAELRGHLAPLLENDGNYNVR